MTQITKMWDSSMTRVVRSATFKQFLLRVHPDHFRSIPKVHDENLASIQLLNQFMDDKYASSSQKRVYFSVYKSNKDIVSQENLRNLYRFHLDLTSNVEMRMRHILAECGLQVEKSNPSASHHFVENENRDTRESTRSSGMDYGYSSHFEVYARNSSSHRRQRISVASMSDFFTFIQQPDTIVKQQHNRVAFQSIESIKHTLQREWNIRNITTSCGWSSVHLNTVMMSLLKTLRDLNKCKMTSSLLRQANLDIDLRSDESEMDYFNEYILGLNVADVPVQWIQTLKQIDTKIINYIQKSRESLASAQKHGEHGVNAEIVRGFTCSAIAYRGFLQEMERINRFHDHLSYRTSKLITKATLIVEDSGISCRILEDGRVQVPSAASAVLVFDFLESHQSRIQEQRQRYEKEQQRWKQLAILTKSKFGLQSLTFAPTLSLEKVNQSIEEFLQETRIPYSSEVLPGNSIRIDRTYGIGHDGIFTIPIDWYKYSF